MEQEEDSNPDVDGAQAARSPEALARHPVSKNTGAPSSLPWGPQSFSAFASNTYPQNTCYLPVSGFAYCIFRIEFFQEQLPQYNFVNL